MRTAQEAKALFDEYRSEYRKKGYSDHKPLHNGVVIKAFQDACGNEQQRHAVQSYLFHKESTRGVDTEIRYALQRFVAPTYVPETKSWDVREGLYEDCQTILAHLSQRKAYERSLLEELGYE